MDSNAGSPEPVELPALGRIDRRVLGALLEKGLTTPEYYPLTFKALLAGCNQKSNRDPVTSYRDEEVEDAVVRLRASGLVAEVIGMTGRAMRYRQDLGKVYGLDATELAIVGELLLRGAQAEGDLRARANRMRPIPDQNTLRERLKGLTERSPAFVVRLSPAHVQRGVRWTHCLGAEAERESDLAEAAESPVQQKSAQTASRSPTSLERRLAELEARVAALEHRWPDP